MYRIHFLIMIMAWKKINYSCNGTNKRKISDTHMNNKLLTVVMH